MSPYKLSKQWLIIFIAYCGIYNYMRNWNLYDDLFRIQEKIDLIELEAMNEGFIIEGIISMLIS